MTKGNNYAYPESIIGHLRRNIHLFHRGLIFAILRTVAVAPIPWLFQIIIDEHVATANVVGVLFTGVIVFGLVLVHYTFAVLGASEISRENGLLLLRLRGDIFNKLHFLNFGYLDRQKTGRLLSKYAFDTQRIEGITMQVMNQFVPEMLYSVTITVILISLHWQLTLILLLLIPIYGLARRLFHSRLKLLHRRSRLAQEKLTGAASEAINALRLVRSFGEEDQVTENMDGYSFKLTRSRYNLSLLNMMFNAFSYSMVQLFTLLTLAGGALFAIGGTMTMGTLFAFMAALPIVLQPVQLISTLIEQYYLAQEGYNSVKELLDSPYVESWTGQEILEPLQGGIEFDRVTFAYPQTSQNVLVDISLKIDPGKNVALAGPSGSGKSTIAQLIIGLYKPSEGEIRIDGVPQSDLNMRWLRKQTAVVLQDIVLFSGTIAENIRFARPDATDKELEEAARMANAEEFIESLSDGYDTIVGERGAMLSGGQRQRISIARAILRNPRILILDEATSALDYHSERLVQEAMRRVARGRTVITIAHRLSTIRQADEIVVMRQGRIVEQGSYRELAAGTGPFSDLLKQQSSVEDTLSPL